MATLTPKMPTQETLDTCRDSLMKLIDARAHEQWGMERQLQEIRCNAVLGALADGWHPSTVAEATGMSEMEVREIRDNHR